MDSVEVSPADLKFKFVLNKQLLATIVITNNTDSRLAYKIKTTAPKKYVVRPSSGIAEPKGPVTIQVSRSACGVWIYVFIIGGAIHFASLSGRAVPAWPTAVGRGTATLGHSGTQ